MLHKCDHSESRFPLRIENQTCETSVRLRPCRPAAGSGACPGLSAHRPSGAGENWRRTLRRAALNGSRTPKKSSAKYLHLIFIAGEAVPPSAKRSRQTAVVSEQLKPASNPEALDMLKKGVDILRQLKEKTGLSVEEEK